MNLSLEERVVRITVEFALSALSPLSLVSSSIVVTCFTLAV